MIKRWRINVYITEDFDKRLTVEAKKIGLPKGKMAFLAMQAGLQAITLAVNPDWKEFFQKVTSEEKND
jgi:hypothetical protein